MTGCVEGPFGAAPPSPREIRNVTGEPEIAAWTVGLPAAPAALVTAVATRSASSAIAATAERSCRCEPLAIRVRPLSVGGRRARLTRDQVDRDPNVRLGRADVPLRTVERTSRRRLDARCERLRVPDARDDCTQLHALPV